MFRFLLALIYVNFSIYLAEIFVTEGIMLFHRLSRLGSRIVKELPRGIYLSSLLLFGHERKANIHCDI